MPEFEIVDGPAGYARRVRLDGADISHLINEYSVHNSVLSESPDIDLHIGVGAVRGSMTVSDDSLHVDTDFPAYLIELLGRAGWRRESDSVAEVAEDPNAAAYRVFDRLQDEIKRINIANGWYDRERAFGDDIALLHSEVTEAYEAYRKEDWDEFNTQSDTEPTTPGYNPSSVPAEFADILIRLLDTCSRYGIDLYGATVRKMQYNAQRPYRHGNKVV